MAITLNKFQCVSADLANKVHNLGADTLMVCLSNTQPLVTNTVYTDIVDLPTGFGYTTGGVVVPIASSTQIGGNYKLIPTGVTLFTPVGGNIGPFQFVILYNSTVINKNLLGWFDYGSALTLNATNNDTFNITWDLSQGLIQLN
jgi:hypothetical protein